jgi:hypothetical protein
MSPSGLRQTSVVVRQEHGQDGLHLLVHPGHGLAKGAGGQIKRGKRLGNQGGDEILPARSHAHGVDHQIGDVHHGRLQAPARPPRAMVQAHGTDQAFRKTPPGQKNSAQGGVIETEDIAFGQAQQHVLAAGQPQGPPEGLGRFR